MDAGIWYLIGIALLAAEMLVSTGFYLLILGVAALVVGGLTHSGLVGTWMLQAVVFSVCSLGIWYFFAERLQTLLRSKEKEYQGLIGQVARAQEAIAPGHKGGGELWGSPWRMENIGSSSINVGDECEVVSSDGLVLQVTSKH
jgi:membrane protein implicated in regulation of membrane protease activity